MKGEYVTVAWTVPLEFRCTLVYMHTHTHTHTRTRTHAHAHARTHTLTHTHTQGLTNRQAGINDKVTALLGRVRSQCDVNDLPMVAGLSYSTQRVCI